ncbi:unnamed protein product [Rotaria magnacalcarata]|uniref:Knr4/Smi1-like domain-containing protein n=2 Tax=Rotaria magnacalcarata TaxID=392030 RepID=A0A816WBC1_9BILA|nr:unnamed protein product [Rotaria magnacalcarata]CAF2135084.1 unnamed protein product [Rotaria magnacalcarata]CAF2144032.1 unnamed protein product [Rotaria magnacalcarata]CAF3824423.1 unnamed protein product [Rotaria magnacalcarata]CAF3899105.1 unnamed protein product [Rotaria magnacalcarata]
MSVQESFSRIESWLSKNAPNVLHQLNKPISSVDELDKAEAILGAKFPPSVREAYTYHDGESTESTGLFGGWRWLPLREIIQWNNEQMQYGQKHQFLDFKPSFMIPLLVLNNDLRYVETSGDDGLEETLVIEWNHEQPSRDVKYGSFANYLSTFAERLESGEYITDANDQQTARGLILRK